MNYQPIENYGVIGDLGTVALVSLDGSVDFMCFPDFDSPSIFAALLDCEKGGFFCIRPQFSQMRTRQLYLPDTNVLLTRFLSTDGVGEITDFMPVDGVCDCKKTRVRNEQLRSYSYGFYTGSRPCDSFNSAVEACRKKPRDTRKTHAL